MNGKESLNSNKFLNIAKNIGDTLKTTVQFKQLESIGGGCINQVSKVSDDKGNEWLIKENSPHLLDMFIAEANGLNEIHNTGTIRCPEVICYGETQQNAYLVIEYISLVNGSGSALTGEKLALMHQYQGAIHGWHRDNTIGSTPQSNLQSASWIKFWKQQRLIPQLELALKKGYSKRDYDNGLMLCDKLELFFKPYTPAPSLLHGDLWGGNQAHDSSGNPVIFDPAVYYGDRETDLAMTELFGGFSTNFYAAYNQHFALDEGYTTRKTLYNLYHVLNHYNLFGSSYASQAGSMTRRLLTEI
ncbi:MAG: fructosamine kinase family protein [Cocleimonas sp.]|nr:fructosamine kinase family protein [Cocleimonas sp.]